MKLSKYDKLITKKIQEFADNEKQFMLQVLNETIRLYEDFDPEVAMNFVKNVKGGIEKSKNVFGE